MAYRIFLVDDDRFLLDLYAVKFKNAGHEVTAFGSGEECLAALRKKEAPPHAILMDLIMPGIGGFEMLQTIRSEGLAEGSKIIILSNQGGEADVAQAKALHADSYIIKASAIPSEVLAETVKTIEAGRGAAPTL